MQAQAAEFSVFRRKIPLLFRHKSLKRFVSIYLFLKQSLKQTLRVCLRAF